MGSLIAACVVFVGTHFLLSHPLRGALVRRVGEGPFLGIYSLVALASFAWIIHAWRALPTQPWVMTPGDTIWATASAVMLLASMLFVGSLIGNPAAPNPNADAGRAVPPAAGVFAITRHPMMWAFALWAIVHLFVNPTPASHVVNLAIIVLALGGARAQDRKKEALQPQFWREWEARTSFWPFAKWRQGDWSAQHRGTIALVGGLGFWLVVTWAHIPLSGWAAGVWRWLG